METLGDENKQFSHKELLQVFEPAFVKNLIPSHLLPYLPFLRESLNEIRRAERDVSTQKAVTVLFEKLQAVDEEKEPGWFQTFLGALKSAEFHPLANLLQDTLTHSPETDENCKHIINVFTPLLYEKIIPRDVLPNLFAKAVISQVDKEEIMAEETNHGPQAATLMLIDRIYRHKPGWYRDFLEVLEATGYEHLVKEIDPDFVSGEKKTLDADGANGGVGNNGKESEEDGEYSGYVCEGVEKLNLTGSSSSGSDHLPGQQQTALKEMDSSNVVDLRASVRRAGENRLSYPVQESSQEIVDEDTSQEAQNLRSLEESEPATEVPNNNTSSFEVEPMIQDPALTVSDNEALYSRTADETLSSSEPSQLKLRNYQKELAQPGLEGKNIIVCAPTGSGKTRVALEITKEHLDKADRGRRKVVFLVNQVELMEQQLAVFKKNLTGYRTYGLSGNVDTKVPLSELLPKNDVIVLTAQILLDELRDNVLKVHDFSLMIFDECHHTKKGHPYNGIMAFYIDQKLVPPDVDSHPSIQKKLPQVVGLTASLGVGKAKNIESAKDHILRLCANLDTEVLSTVVQHENEMLQYVNVPKSDIVPVGERAMDPFKDIISRIMEKIENKIKYLHGQHQLQEISAADLNAPADKGEGPYTQWVHSLKGKFAVIDDQKIRWNYKSCLTNLLTYHQALLINEYCRTKDALEYIRDENSKRSTRRNVEIDNWLQRLFQEKESQLDAIAVSDAYQNPKLAELEGMLRKAYEEKPDSRGIVFCKTRALTENLRCWMLETESLKALNPQCLVGTNAAVERRGMTPNQQVDILKYFKDGNTKLLIATSVAEEGLDIQQCNLVIRYDYVTNEIAMVQARGRGRAEGSHYVLLAGVRGTAEREEINIIREIMMKKALLAVKKMSPQEFRGKIHKFQKEAKFEREILRTTQRQLATEDEYELRCLKCDVFACFSFDFRVIEGSHHVVLDKEFMARVEVKPHPHGHKYGNMEKTGKLHCKKCDSDWGIQCLYKGVVLPVLKVVSFVLVDMNGEKKWEKKWKSVPFKVPEINVEDLRKIAASQ
ncbi:probable ATP-dependent RNA helicase DHX58 isoform X2 [Lingula anatina]|uniref:RNA helicase n=1 Tax=Lingula anatina TaxID=7574 RepID=A0A2R2MNY6_LINAN|nr:probable ATP-dependent RNA helicase DHX58 isoform X2 [Lingula anatina]|eukprot:XP_023931940.1 probable ATP-dependent RNA helicase DHX58 isoform X2 [Lingula anatina]